MFMIGDEIQRDCMFFVRSGSLSVLFLCSQSLQLVKTLDDRLSHFSQYTVACNESFTFPRDGRRRKR